MVKRWHEPQQPSKCPDWLASQRPSSPEEQQSECIIWDEGQRVRLKEKRLTHVPTPLRVMPRAEPAGACAPIPTRGAQKSPTGGRGP